MSTVLELHNVVRIFESGGDRVTILKNVSLNVAAGTAIAIRGPSGCGKTTLLHIAGTLDQPTSGTVAILGENPWQMNARRLASFRNQSIGFVFQEHQLLPQCSVLENVLLPTLAGFPGTARPRDRALQLLERVGLQHRLNYRPGRLSGGERQRVAVCRALINRPALLLADEPTGNLDPATAATIGTLLLEVAAEHHSALLCVTHSDALAAGFPNSLTLQNGEIRFLELAGPRPQS